ncbi:MAG: hypothetical protein WC613_05045 [Candidatus Aenigmatarchaeota archaeon]
MARIDKAVFDAGPLIHLSQISALDALRLVNKAIIPYGVFEEIKFDSQNVQLKKRLERNIKIIYMSKDSNDMAKILSEKYSLGLGESQAIVLAKQENVKLIFTDDLDARTVAKSFGFEVHGTIGLVLRSYKEKFLAKKRAISIVRDLEEKSTLFLTSDLVEYILKEIK